MPGKLQTLSFLSKCRSTTVYLLLLGRIWDLTVLSFDHWLSLYFSVIVNNFASLLNCTQVGQASDSVMSPTWSSLIGWDPELFCLLFVWWVSAGGLLLPSISVWESPGVVASCFSVLIFFLTVFFFFLLSLILAVSEVEKRFFFLVWRL